MQLVLPIRKARSGHHRPPRPSFRSFPDISTRKRPLTAGAQSRRGRGYAARVACDGAEDRSAGFSQEGARSGKIKYPGATDAVPVPGTSYCVSGNTPSKWYQLESEIARAESPALASATRARESPRSPMFHAGRPHLQPAGERKGDLGDEVEGRDILRESPHRLVAASRKVIGSE